MMTLFDFLTASDQQQFANSIDLLKRMEQWLRLSRTDAAKLCRLNTATMTHLSASLIANGLLRERGKAQSTAGRKPTFLELEPAAGYSIVLHLKPDHAQLTLHNLRHEIVAATRLPALTDETDPEDYLYNTMKPADFAQGYEGVLGGCVICGHDCAPEQEQITRLSELWRADAPYPVYLANAASMTCLAEGHLRCPDQDATLLTLSISAQHVSTGVLLGSQLLFDGVYPGMMSRRSNGVSASGEDLCLNSLALRAYQHDAALRGAAAYNTTELLSSTSPHGEICRLARNGNPDALSVIDGYAEALAGLIDDLLRLYRPDTLILDGEILLYMEAINPALHAKLQEIAPPTIPAVNTPFLGQLACAYGASRLCVRRALETIPEKEARP